MKSAYAILGIPGNASLDDIEAAYRKCCAHYTKEKLASDSHAADNFREIQDAYRLLRSPEFRAAHDRKLSNAAYQPRSRPVVVIEQAETPWYTKPLTVMAIAVAVMIGSGAYISYSRAQERKEQAARELAREKKEAEAAQQAQRELAQEQAERARQQADNERRERQFRMESSATAAAAARMDAQQQAAFNRQQEADRREAMRRESDAKQAERQRVYEAERRVARDKQTLRELCFQRYGRPDC